MRRVWCSTILVGGLLFSAGCVLTEPQVREPGSPPANLAAKAPPPVRADQVTPENGHQIAQALEAELTWENQQRLLQPR